MALNISGRMIVKTLKNQFKEEFGLTLRIYDGRSFASDNSTLASIRKGTSKGGEFAPQKNMKVGNFEARMMEMFGIKVQIAGSDDSYLCQDELTLAKALEVDATKIQKKKDKLSKNGHENVKITSDITNDGGKKFYKCKLEATEEEQYQIQWLNEEKEIHAFKPVLDNINFYDEEDGEDIQIYEPDLIVDSFDYKYLPIGDDNFGLIFKAEIQISLTEREYEILIEEHDGYVDYSFDFIDDDENAAEPDEDFEFVENRNISLILLDHDQS